MSAKAGAVVEAEVVLQDGGDQEGQLGVCGIGGVCEIVLAIAIGVIEQAAFRNSRCHLSTSTGGGPNMYLSSQSAISM